MYMTRLQQVFSYKYENLVIGYHLYKLKDMVGKFKLLGKQVLDKMFKKIWMSLPPEFDHFNPVFNPVH